MTASLQESQWPQAKRLLYFLQIRGMPTSAITLKRWATQLKQDMAHLKKVEEITRRRLEEFEKGRLEEMAKKKPKTYVIVIDD